MSIQKKAAIAAIAATAIGSVGSESPVSVDQAQNTDEKGRTILALKNFNAGQESALKSLAEKLRSSSLGKDDAKLLDELLAAGSDTLADIQSNPLTDAQSTYLKPVQTHVL